jgi:ABC-2 type transport system ATP-binding protein
VANIIEVTDLIKKYKKATTNAVDRITFEVGEGEFFTMLGPNGAGKTTTISILNTTLQKTSGNVKVGGVEIDADPEAVRKIIGVIFQNPSLDLNLTAEENVRFHALMYGLFPYRPSFSLMPKAYRNKVKQLSEILGIEKEIHQPVKTFSGGMKRKLEIVRGLIHRPRLLFLDEPTTGLDPQSRKNLWSYLKKVRQEQGLTIFLTTHYLEEAEESDRIGIIDHGQLVTLGTPREIKKQIVEDYLMLDADSRDKLTKELSQLGYRFDEGEEVKVYIDSDEIQKLIGNLKVKLTTIKTHTPTVEEAYLEIIQKGHETDN